MPSDQSIDRTLDMSSPLHSMPDTLESGLVIEAPTRKALVLPVPLLVVQPNPCPSAAVASLASSTSTSASASTMEEADEQSHQPPFDDVHEDLMASNTVPRKMMELASGTIDARLANELNQLSMKEREDVIHDIHGVADIVQETPQLLQQSLEEMQQALDQMTSDSSQQIPKHKKACAAYLLAKEQNHDYLQNPKLLVSFLRSESFDPQKAATRLLHFVTEKLILFGPEKVGRDILLSDLDSQDLKALESGFFQLLPARDRAGRAILCGIPALRNYQVTENLVRTSTSFHVIY
jgi:hypothetical protein